MAAKIFNPKKPVNIIAASKNIDVPVMVMTNSASDTSWKNHAHVIAAQLFGCGLLEKKDFFVVKNEEKGRKIVRLSPSHDSKVKESLTLVQRAWSVSTPSWVLFAQIDSTAANLGQSKIVLGSEGCTDGVFGHILTAVKDALLSDSTTFEHVQIELTGDMKSSGKMTVLANGELKWSDTPPFAAPK